MDIEEQLRTALRACAPRPQLRVRILSTVSDARRLSWARSKTIVLGLLFAVAAAAMMLVYQMDRTERPTAAAVQLVAPPDTITTERSVERNEQVKATQVPNMLLEVEPGSALASAEEGVSAPQPFTLVVLPLTDNTTDAAAKAAVETFYEALLGNLRTVPGIVLLRSEPTHPEELSVYYRVTLRGWGSFPESKFRVSMESEEIRQAWNGPPSKVSVSLAGDIVSSCIPAPDQEDLSCASAQGFASYVFGMLRKQLLPPDPLLRLRLQRQVLDASIDSGQRLKALAALDELKPQAGDIGSKDADSQIAVAMVQGAKNIIATAIDPALRAQVWQTMRESRQRRNPDLVSAAINSLRKDSDGEVRLQAAALLQESLVTDAKAREALEIAAREDSRPVVRALAQSAFSGESVWRQYVFSSLKDESRSDPERTEAFLFFAVQSGPGWFKSTGRLTRSRDSLDDDAVRALGELAVRSQDFRRALVYVVPELRSQSGDAMTSLLLKLLDGAATSERFKLVDQLTRQVLDDRAVATLKKMSTADADSRIREMAAKALQDLPDR